MQLKYSALQYLFNADSI